MRPRHHAVEQLEGLMSKMGKVEKKQRTANRNPGSKGRSFNRNIL